MNWHVRTLVVVLGCSLLGLPEPLRAAAIDQLRNLAGGSVPNVPEPSGPSPVEDSGGGQSTATNNAAADAAAAAEADAELDRLEAEYQAQQERAEKERLAREEQERKQREEAARQERLRTQAAAAHQQWLATDERNGAAFDDVFAQPVVAGGGAASDPNVVDLSISSPPASPHQRSNAAGRPLRLKPVPPPVPDFTLMPVAEDSPPPTAFWWPDFERKTNDTAFAYVSMYLKSKVRGLGSIPEKIKDSLELRKKLSERFTQHIESVFAIAGQATDTRANWSVLAERSETQFKVFASAVDEESRNGIRDTLATSGSGALPEDGAEAAEFGISAGREHLQDFQEYKKWCDENRKKRR